MEEQSVCFGTGREKPEKKHAFYSSPTPGYLPDITLDYLTSCKKPTVNTGACQVLLLCRPVTLPA